MLREQFIGRNPSHFHINPIVKAFIISETFIWSSWNFFIPIFAIFVVRNISGGNLEIAASVYSAHLIARVIFELISAKLLSKDEKQKITISIVGLSFLSLSYVGLALSNSIFQLFVFYIIAGFGFGIASPAKNSLFSSHLDKNRESTEWSFYDAITFIAIALATAFGGFIATGYGFKFLFFLSAIVNILGIIPYLLYLRKS